MGTEVGKGVGKTTKLINLRVKFAKKIHPLGGGGSEYRDNRKG